MNNIVIAIPKGRIMKQVFALFNRIGYHIDDIDNDRKLVVQDEANKFTYLFVKPSDVCTYVEEGICDIGIVGNDVIKEQDKDIYELYDLKIGKCKMIVAGKNDSDYLRKQTLVVATKYPNTAKEYLKKYGQEIRIVKLNGSVELGPLVELSDVIVDITETGKTLEANNLKIYDELFPISSRIIANKASYRKQYLGINQLINRLKKYGDQNA